MSKATNEYQELHRIVLLLLGLAQMADRASRRAFPIRFLVLWLLRPAEPYARNLVMRAVRELGYQAVLPPCFTDMIAPSLFGFEGNRSAGALRLALIFEILAAILRDVIELASRQPRTLKLEDRSLLLSAMKRARLQFKRNRFSAGTSARSAGGAGGDAYVRNPAVPPAFARAPPF